jgi:hypothetical protein
MGREQFKVVTQERPPIGVGAGIEPPGALQKDY